MCGTFGICDTKGGTPDSVPFLCCGYQRCFHHLDSFNIAIRRSSRLSYGIGFLVMIIVNNFFTCICWIPLVVAYSIETVTTKQRSIYFAITILSISETSFVPSYLTPVGIANIGWHYYIPTCLWNVVLVFILYFTFVETRSLTLEKIATLFDGHEDFDSNAIAVSHDMEMKTVELFTHYESVEPKISSEK